MNICHLQCLTLYQLEKAGLRRLLQDTGVFMESLRGGCDVSSIYVIFYQFSLFIKHFSFLEKVVPFVNPAKCVQKKSNSIYFTYI